jgi:hypothetical protein
MMQHSHLTIKDKRTISKVIKHLENQNKLKKSNSHLL